MRLLAALAVAAAALAGCAGASAPAAAVEPMGTVEFPRILQADRQVQVNLEPAAGAAGVVTEVELVSPYFESAGPVAVNVRLFEGFVSRVRVPLGAPACPAGGGASTAMVRVDGAEPQPVALDDAVLAAINAEECARKEATDAAQPSFGPVTFADDAELLTSIVFTRGSSDAAVAVTGLRGNIIFSVEPVDPAALPLTLGPGEASAAVPVRVVASRCDPHAFAESKKTFVFPVWLSVAGGAERYVEFQPDTAMRARLQALFDACGATASQ